MRTAADIIAEIAYDAFWDNLIDADEPFVGLNGLYGVPTAARQLIPAIRRDP